MWDASMIQAQVTIKKKRIANELSCPSGRKSVHKDVAIQTSPRSDPCVALIAACEQAIAD
jgi:hypothetical protein